MTILTYVASNGTLFVFTDRHVMIESIEGAFVVSLGLFSRVVFTEQLRRKERNETHS